MRLDLQTLVFLCLWIAKVSGDDSNACIVNRCLNGGKCIEKRNRFYCECAPGYVGDECETDADECISAPCRNGGACVDGVNKYSCNCKPGFRGSECERGCPAGFAFLAGGNACYKVLIEGLTWAQARARCAEIAYGAYLSIIQNKAEDDDLIRLVTPLNNAVCGIEKGGHQFYISGQTTDPNRCNTPYIWKKTGGDRPMSYTNWGPGEPNCAFGAENCLTLLQRWNYKWNDFPCSESRCAICEYDL